MIAYDVSLSGVVIFVPREGRSLRNMVLETDRQIVLVESLLLAQG
jgi:hypothetical protein